MRGPGSGTMSEHDSDISLREPRDIADVLGLRLVSHRIEDGSPSSLIHPASAGYCSPRCIICGQNHLIRQVCSCEHPQSSRESLIVQISPSASAEYHMIAQE